MKNLESLTQKRRPKECDYLSWQSQRKQTPRISNSCSIERWIAIRGDKFPVIPGEQQGAGPLRGEGVGI